MSSILRLARPTGLLTAQVFEALFARELGGAFAVRHAELGAWCASVLGPADAPWPREQAAAAFAAQARGLDFIAPSYEGMALAPLLAALRNHAGSPARLLLIAHAPGTSLLEWALLAPLLAPGDVIVAPSHSARGVVELLAPSLAPFVRVVPHPMAPLAAPADGDDGGRPRVVSLGRIHPGKLVHRQVEAMGLLRARDVPLPRMEIAGALGDGGGPDPYARSLAEKIRRLGLGDDVRLVGPVLGDAAKARFLAGARVLVNLSATVEESFGKAPVEAMGLGVPVLATDWNGFRETVGDAGVLLPMTRQPGGADVSAAEVADGLARLLADPPSPEACRAQAARFAPAAVIPRYRAVLAEAAAAATVGTVPAWPAADLPAGPPGGALAAAAPLTVLSWAELFASYAEGCDALRGTWEGRPAGTPGLADRVRGLLWLGARVALDTYLGGLPPVDDGQPAVPCGAAADAADPVERFAAAAARPGLLSSRMACLTEVRAAGRAGLLAQVVDGLHAAGAVASGIDYLRSEARLLAEEPEAAYVLCAAWLAPHGGRETESIRLRQMAQATRRMGAPARGLPWLTGWLERFPDSPDSGGVWLELCVSALLCAPAHQDVARAALDRTRALLGPVPAVPALERALSAALLRVAA